MVHPERREASRPLEGVLHPVGVRHGIEHRVRSRHHRRVRHRLRIALLHPPRDVHHRKETVSYVISVL